MDRKGALPLPRTLVAESPAEVERLRPLWGSLYRPAEHTLFQSFEWNLLAARAFAARETPCVIAVENGSGAAIVPACVSPFGLSFVGETLFDYRDMLAAGDEEASASAWRQVALMRAPLQVTAVRGDRERKRWEDAGLVPAPFVNAPCVLRSDIDPAEFFARHNRSARLLRRLSRQGIELQQHSGGNSALVRTIYELKGRQDVPGTENLFADPARREFLVAAAAMWPCDIFTLESPGNLVAALVTFRDGETRRFYTTYYDHAWAHSSPGIALLFEATHRSLAAGLDCDYMTGEQPHKLRFATSSVPLFRVEATCEQLNDLGPQHEKNLIAA